MESMSGQRLEAMSLFRGQHWSLAIRFCVSRNQLTRRRNRVKNMIARLMKNRLSWGAILVALMLTSLNSFATTVYFDLTETPGFGALPATNRQITIQQQSPFQGNIIFLPVTDSLGRTTNNFLNSVGLFNCVIKAPPSQISFQIFITATNLGTIDALTIPASGSSSTYPAGSVAWSIFASDQRYQFSTNTAGNYYYPLYSNPSNYVQNPTLLNSSNYLYNFSVTNPPNLSIASGTLNIQQIIVTTPGALSGYGNGLFSTNGLGYIGSTNFTTSNNVAAMIATIPSVSTNGLASLAFVTNAVNSSSNSVVGFLIASNTANLAITTNNITTTSNALQAQIVSGSVTAAQVTNIVGANAWVLGGNNTTNVLGTIGANQPLKFVSGGLPFLTVSNSGGSVSWNGGYSNTVTSNAKNGGMFSGVSNLLDQTVTGNAIDFAGNVIVGGAYNTNKATAFGFIGDGLFNSLHSTPFESVLNGQSNAVNSLTYGFVLNGNGNAVQTDGGVTIGGQLFGFDWIGNGLLNSVGSYSFFSMVLNGNGNLSGSGDSGAGVYSQFDTIVNGGGNTIQGSGLGYAQNYSTVLNGTNNLIQPYSSSPYNSYYDTILNGISNTIEGYSDTIIGSQVTIDNNNGVAVLSDGTKPFQSAVNDALLLSFSNGVAINTNSSGGYTENVNGTINATTNIYINGSAVATLSVTNGLAPLSTVTNLLNSTSNGVTTAYTSAIVASNNVAGLNSTNFALSIGSNDTNYTIGASNGIIAALQATNTALASAIIASNTAALTVATNQAYLIGGNDTNFARGTIGLAFTNYSLGIGLNATNYTQGNSNGIVSIIQATNTALLSNIQSTNTANLTVTTNLVNSAFLSASNLTVTATNSIQSNLVATNTQLLSDIAATNTTTLTIVTNGFIGTNRFLTAITNNQSPPITLGTVTNSDYSGDGLIINPSSPYIQSINPTFLLEGGQLASHSGTSLLGANNPGDLIIRTDLYTSAGDQHQILDVNGYLTLNAALFVTTNSGAISTNYTKVATNNLANYFNSVLLKATNLTPYNVLINSDIGTNSVNALNTNTIVVQGSGLNTNQGLANIVYQWYPSANIWTNSQTLTYVTNNTASGQYGLFTNQTVMYQTATLNPTAWITVSGVAPAPQNLGQTYGVLNIS